MKTLAKHRKLVTVWKVPLFLSLFVPYSALICQLGEAALIQRTSLLWSPCFYLPGSKSKWPKDAQRLERHHFFPCQLSTYCGLQAQVHSPLWNRNLPKSHDSSAKHESFHHRFTSSTSLAGAFCAKRSMYCDDSSPTFQRRNFEESPVLSSWS